jgi:hypothetical protein
MALTALGLAGLLAALNPTTGTGAVPSPAATLVVAACCVSVMAAAIAWSRHPGAHPPGTGRTGIGRVLALAACTGLGYGVTAVQLKSIGTQLASGPLAPLQHPALHVALVLGPLSILLSQHALQQGRLATAVVSLILVVDPLVGLTAGPLWFGERIDTGLVSLAAAAACAVTLLAGSASRRSARWTSAPPHRLRSRRARPQPDRWRGAPSTSHSSHIGHICAAYRPIHVVVDCERRAADDAGRTRSRRDTTALRRVAAARPPGLRDGGRDRLRHRHRHR